MIYEECLYEFLLLLLKYADDRDVGQFIQNFVTGPIKRKPKNDIAIDDFCNKAILLEHLYESHLINNIELKEVIKSHLKALCSCYNSYVLSSENKANLDFKKLGVSNNPKVCVSSDMLGLEMDGKSISYEDHNEIGDFSKGDIREILKILINSYKDNHFYYYVDNEKLVKVKIIVKNEEIIKEISYPLEFAPRVTYVCDEQTGLKYSLHQKFGGFRNLPNVLILDEQGLKDFKTAHKNIVKALKGIEPCAWCNPINASPNKLCKNCQNLKDELNYLKNKFPLLKDVNFDSVIKTIKLDQFDILKDLRLERKKLIKSYFRKLHNKDDKKELHALLDKSFADIIL